MFIVSNYFLISYMLAVFAISTFDTSLQSNATYVYDSVHESQEDHNRNDFIPKIYRTSKHVFYWLYTRDNATGQLLNRNEPHMTESTTYDAKNPLIVLVHGWLGTTQKKESLCSSCVKSYLKVGDFNVICVDWKQYSTDVTYAVATVRAKYIGRDIAAVLSKITNRMTKGVDGMHLIGHSMGAHIVGFAGKKCRAQSTQIPRITALDPAKPMYENSGPKDRIYKTDAKRVVGIHTNMGQNGLNITVGHINFCPNGGIRQLNCSIADHATGWCSHLKAIHYFAHSIWAKEDYVAVKCSSWEDYLADNCDTSDTTYMGEHASPWKTGDYYLRVTIDD